MSASPHFRDGIFDPEIPTTGDDEGILDLSYQWLNDKHAALIADWIRERHRLVLDDYSDDDKFEMCYQLNLSHNQISHIGASLIINAVCNGPAHNPPVSPLFDIVDLSYNPIYTEEYDISKLDFSAKASIIYPHFCNFELGQEYHPVSKIHIVSPDNPPTQKIDNLREKIYLSFKNFIPPGTPHKI